MSPASNWRRSIYPVQHLSTLPVHGHEAWVSQTNRLVIKDLDSYVSVYSWSGGGLVRERQVSLPGMKVRRLFITEAAVLIYETSGPTHVYNLELSQTLNTYQHGEPRSVTAEHVVFLHGRTLSVRAVSGGSWLYDLPPPAGQQWYYPTVSPIASTGGWAVANGSSLCLYNREGWTFLCCPLFCTKQTTLCILFYN